MNILSTSSEETQRIGTHIGETLKSPLLICLQGTLGAGKTTFTQGLAKGMGIPSDIPITSPTYAIIHEYAGRHLPLYHVDVYRLDGSEEDLENIGFYELLPAGIVVVEWAERLDTLTRNNALIISLRINDTNHHRSIHISANGQNAKEVYSNIAKRLEGVVS